MKMDDISPKDIERKSFEIIRETLGERVFEKDKEQIIFRVIHTSADFEYADSLYFSKSAVEIMRIAIKDGADIVTDTNMAKAGINKKVLSKFGGTVHCFMADDDVAIEAEQRGVTRAIVSVERAALIKKPVIFAIGNAPTALLRLCEMIDAAALSPAGVIGVPVGFVNVVESKEQIMERDCPCIVARGRKGGSNIAAAICNALIYSLSGD